MRIRQLFAFTTLGLLFGFSMPAVSQEILSGSREILPGVPCDFNSAGVCDAADYVRWQNGSPLENEGVSPGVVDPADHGFWQVGFGNVVGSGAVTPEPSTLFLTIAALAALSTRRRRQ